MPSANSQVLFSAGSAANYAALQTKNDNTIYFLTDTNQIFVGSVEYTKGGEILTSAPTTATVGYAGKLYAYNGNLYLCEGKNASNEYVYTRVANVNDVVGSVTEVVAGEGLDGGTITTTGTISHAVPAGASATSVAGQTLTPAFGDTITLQLVSSTDKYGHVTGTAETTVKLPSETAVSVETATGSAQSLSYGDSFTVVTGVELGDADQSIKRTVTEFTLPASDDTTYTFTSTKEGKVTVTPSAGSAYDVTINGWEGLAKKSEIASVFTFRGTVADVASLPKTGVIGDVYHVTAKNSEYVCVAASSDTLDAQWEELGSEIDLSAYALSDDVIQRVTGADDMIPKFAADGTLVSTGKQISDFVEKTTTIAGLDLQDNIAVSELQTALQISDKIKSEGKDATYKTGTVEGQPVETSIKDALDDIYSQIGEGGSVAAQIDAAIHALDSTVTNAVQSGDQPDVVVSVAEQDGKLTSVTATVTANRFDAYGAAQALANQLGAAAYKDVSYSVAVGGDSIPTAAQVKAYVDGAIAWSTF